MKLEIRKVYIYIYTFYSVTFQPLFGFASKIYVYIYILEARLDRG